MNVVDLSEDVNEKVDQEVSEAYELVQNEARQTELKWAAITGMFATYPQRALLSDCLWDEEKWKEFHYNLKAYDMISRWHFIQFKRMPSLEKMFHMLYIIYSDKAILGEFEEILGKGECPLVNRYQVDIYKFVGFMEKHFSGLMAK